MCSLSGFGVAIWFGVSAVVRLCSLQALGCRVRLLGLGFRGFGFRDLELRASGFSALRIAVVVFI